MVPGKTDWGMALIGDFLPCAPCDEGVVLHYQIEEGAPRPTRAITERVTEMTAATEMTTKAFAEAIGTDPKTLRKFLRATTPSDQHPGKGGRWVLPGTKAVLVKARKDFARWQKEQAEAQAERAAKAVKDAQDAIDASEDSDAGDEDSHEESED